MENYWCSYSYQNLPLLFLFLIMCSFATSLSAAQLSVEPSAHNYGRKLAALVPSTPLVLEYHNGPLLTGPGSINVYILWYGQFTPVQKATITDFFSSFQAPNAAGHPSVSTWWATMEGYKDSAKLGVSRFVKIGGQVADASASLGKNLKRSNIGALVAGALAKKLFPTDAKGVYIVLTADDVQVERFCMNSCGFHDSMPVSRGGKILLGWVGNSAKQCPGQCAWPFAAPLYGPPTTPLVPPNGDVGVDGMIINIATILAGTATNPLKTGYYQGDALAPLEAVTACPGMFGKGAYSGYPGELLVDPKSKGSFNAFGINRRKFLLPGLWEPAKLSCTTTLA
eukprot:Gb_35579 [translate_table: standard]